MLDTHWISRFGDTPPIAHRFRDLYCDRWVRFHSLPDSKRYAETESEWATLLERHNAVVSQLTADGTQLELLTTNWSEDQAPDGPPDDIRELHLSPLHWRTVAMHEVDGDTDPNYWHIFRSTITWVPGSLDNVFRLVAEDRIANVMVLDPASSWLLHPYDGGLDVILGTRDERDTMSIAFKSWRSRRSDGL